MMIDIRMVMHILNAITIFTIHGGNQSNRMVFGVNLSTYIMMRNTIDSRIAPVPAIIEPVRNDWRPRQLLKIGLAILNVDFRIQFNLYDQQSGYSIGNGQMQKIIFINENVLGIESLNALNNLICVLNWSINKNKKKTNDPLTSPGQIHQSFLVVYQWTFIMCCMHKFM